MAASMVSSSLLLKRVVKAPTAVANVLDWNKATGGGVATAMTIDVHADRIGLTLATLRSDRPPEPLHGLRRRSRPQTGHTSSDLGMHCSGHGYSYSCTQLDSIPLVATGEIASEDAERMSATINSPRRRRRRKREIPPDTQRKLAELVRDHGVCGFVVSWPVQRDTGLVGASCGRTLWTLEQLLRGEGDQDDDASGVPIFAPHRPLCLWDGSRHKGDRPAIDMDSFGRCSLYARSPSDSPALSSEELRHEEPPAAEVWRDFCHHHWPAAVPSEHGECHHPTPEPSEEAQSTARVHPSPYKGHRRRTLLAA